MKSLRAVLPLIYSIAACGGEVGETARSASAVTLRDSAGITIVENHDSLRAGGPRR